MKRNRAIQLFTAAVALPLLAFTIYPASSQAAGPNGTLTVIKHVINGSGGSATAANFLIHVTQGGVEVAGSPAAGIDVVGRSYSLAPGIYDVSEPATAGYTTTYSGLAAPGDSSTVTSVHHTVTVSSSLTSVITVTNTQNLPAGTLTVITHVINNGGGTSAAADFPITIQQGGVDAAGSPAPGVDGVGRMYTLAPGIYDVSQPLNVAYTSSYSGFAAPGDSLTVTTDHHYVTVTSNQNSVITITNDDINLGTLTVIKHVVNRYTGKAVAGDFTMHVKFHSVDVAGSPAAGVDGAGRVYHLLPGNYAVSEDDVPMYFGNFDGPDLSNGYVTVVSDQNVTVSRTNYDMFDRTAVTPTPTPTPVVTPTPTPTPAPTGTVTGGTLPKTGTPWNNLLALGAGLILIGAVGFTSRKVTK